MDKQSIYLKWMSFATRLFTMMDTFDIAVCSYYMKQIYLYEMSEKQMDVNTNYYTLRKGELSTMIDEFTYPGLKDIFLQHVTSILDSNSNIFSQTCALPESACTPSEEIRSTKTISESDYKEPGNLIKNFKKYDEPPAMGESKCKMCFKYSPEIQNFKVTDGFLAKMFSPESISMLHELEENGQYKSSKIKNTKGRELIMPLVSFLHSDMFQVYMTYSGIRVPSINLIFKNRFSDVFFNMYGYYVYGLSVKHTEIEHGNIILEEVKKAWSRDKTKRDCFYLHWLLSVATPFQRGSAGFAKVILNAALLSIGESPVKETEYFFTKTDWVAMFCPTFEEYEKDIPIMFEPDDMKLYEFDPSQFTILSPYPTPRKNAYFGIGKRRTKRARNAKRVSKRVHLKI